MNDNDQDDDSIASPRMNGSYLKHSADSLPPYKRFTAAEIKRITMHVRRIEMGIGINTRFVPKLPKCFDKD